jgi:hypothetical protein
VRTKPLNTYTAAIAVAALLAVTLAACGGAVSTGSFKGPSKAVAQRISDFQSDVTARDEKKLCGRDLASAVQTRLRAAGSTCVEAFKKQLGAVDDFELSISSIAVHGSNATARVKSTWSGKQRTTTMQLVREGGAWKIATVQ